jgi:hypothetical protein
MDLSGIYYLIFDVFKEDSPVVFLQSIHCKKVPRKNIIYKDLIDVIILEG